MPAKMALTLSEATTMMNAALAKATELDIYMNCSVVDAVSPTFLLHFPRGGVGREEPEGFCWRRAGGWWPLGGWTARSGQGDTAPRPKPSPQPPSASPACATRPLTWLVINAA